RHREERRGAARHPPHPPGQRPRHGAPDRPRGTRQDQPDPARTAAVVRGDVIREHPVDTCAGHLARPARRGHGRPAGTSRPGCRAAGGRDDRCRRPGGRARSRRPAHRALPAGVCHRRVLRPHGPSGVPPARHRRFRDRRSGAALPCAAAREPVRLYHLPGELTAMAIVLGPNQYGKAENRLVRIYRETPRHEIRDLSVSTSLRGDFDAAHVTGDQSAVLPTDTQKNTIFAYARQYGVDQIEDFALLLARHFVADITSVNAARVDIEEYGWERI